MYKVAGPLQVQGVPDQIGRNRADEAERQGVIPLAQQTGGSNHRRRLSRWRAGIDLTIAHPGRCSASTRRTEERPGHILPVADYVSAPLDQNYAGLAHFYG